MRKLLLGTAAVALGMAAAASHAQAAEGIKLDIGGYMKGYVSWLDQDETDGAGEDVSDARAFDILRDTEVHFTGETTLDNGLTVGFHTEQVADPGNSFDSQESYAYFSGAWGRVNFGAEDGAAYLLQVAAPSADANVDGLRQYIQPVNYAITPDGDASPADDLVDFAALLTGTQLDYAQDITGYYDKLTYMTPVFNGFQAGFSYTPDVLGLGANVSRGLLGNTLDDVENALGQGWEGSARYEGQFDQIALTVGAGYTHVDLEKDDVAAAALVSSLDDRKAWNVGANVGFSAFNIGAVYKRDNNGFDNEGDTRTWILGADYTTGPFKIGASYMDREDELSAGAGVVATPDLDTNRYSGGVVYTYGPGMTFRGSVQYIEHDGNTAGSADIDATSVLLGTQINF